MRVTCDFVGFLRAVRDGIWKIEGVEGEEKAWDETVRLRERMFWARLGTAGWNHQGQNGKHGDLERFSSETIGSGVDIIPKPRVVTPDLQITKTFEEEPLQNVDVERAQSESKSEVNTANHVTAPNDAEKREVDNEKRDDSRCE